MSANATVWTVGHSNHDLDVFLDLVRSARLQAVADVRSDPDRVFRDHFRSEPLRAALTAAGVAYRWFGEQLGGRSRTPEHFDAEGHARYDLMAEQPAFSRALDEVVTVAAVHRVAVMCSATRPSVTAAFSSAGHWCSEESG